MRSRLSRPRLVIAASSALACVAMVLVPRAQAAPPPASTDRLVVRSVDASAYPEIDVVTQQTTDAGISLLANGQTPQGASARSIVDSGRKIGVAYVVDTTKLMGVDDALGTTVAALRAAAKSLAPNEQMAVVMAGVNARVVNRLSSSADEISASLESMSITNRTEAAPYDAVALAVRLFDESPDVQPNIVLVTASIDANLGTRYSAIRGDLLNKGIGLSAITLASKGVNHGALQQLARDSGGRVLPLDRPTGIPDALDTARAYVESQRVLHFTAPAGVKVLTLSLAAGTAAASAMVTPGALVKGVNVSPRSALGQGEVGPSFLRTTNGKLLGAGLALVAFVLAAFGIGLMLIRDEHGLDRALAHYGQDPRRGDEDDEEQGRVNSQFIQKAVDFTSKMAEQRGVLARAEAALERADLPLRAGEAMFFYAAIALVLTGAVFALTGALLNAFIALVLMALMPPTILNFLAKRRQKKFQAMLPDLLQLLSSTLKAGYSLMQGVEAVSREVANPAAKELRRIVVEARLGRPLEDAMSDAADRMGSADFRWAVMAIGIQREVGGNLAELLLTVADTMVQRERLRRDVNALTAEGRVSAYMLGVLPLGVGAAMYSLNKAYVMTLFTDPTGRILTGVAGMGMLLGFLWMKQMIKVDV